MPRSLLVCLIIWSVARTLFGAEAGAVDSRFNANLSESAGALYCFNALPDGRLIVSGGFDRIGSLKAHQRGALAFDGTPVPFAASDAIWRVDWSAPLKDGGALLLAVSHTDLENVRSSFYKVDATGTLNPSPLLIQQPDFGFEPPVQHPDGSVTVRGGTNYYRFDSTGALMGKFSPPPDLRLADLFAGLAGGRVLIRQTPIPGGSSEVKIYSPVEGVLAEGSIEDRLLLGSRESTPSTDGTRILARSHLNQEVLFKLSENGVVDTDFIPAFGAGSTFTATAALDDGGALVAGTLFDSAGTPLGKLARLKATGEIDPTFAPDTGNIGCIQLFAKAPGNAWYFNAAEGNETVIGKITESGAVDASFRVPVYRRPTVQSIALLPSGQVAFGGPSSRDVWTTNGAVSVRESNGSFPPTPSQHTTREAWDLAALPDGSLLVLGFAADFNLFTRLYPDGSAFPGFHANLSSVGSGAALRPLIHPLADGKIIISGGQVNGFDTNYAGTERGPLTVLLSNGQPDFEFQSARVFSPSSSSISLVVAADGKILLSGYFTATNGSPLPTVVRLRPNGTLDETFQYGPGSPPHRPVLGQFSNGRILLGDAGTTNASERARALVRLNNDGSIDPDFQSVLGAGSRISAAAIQGDDRILIGGLLWNTNGSRLSAVIRLESDGSLDESFATDFASTPGDPEIYRIVVLPDGDIVIAGSFEIGGQFSLVKLRSAEKPHLKPVSVSPGSLALEVAGNIGRTYSIQSSTNFVDWISSGSVSLSSPTNLWPLPASVPTGSRFFRALLQPDP